MAVTDLAAVTNQIQKIWAPLFTKELREQLLLGSLVNKDYQGQINKLNDTVYVSQINAPAGQLLTVGVDANSFDTDVMSTSRISIQANKRAVAAFVLEDLVDLQSQLGMQESEIRNSLKFSVEKQINDYLYSLFIPSASAPDHQVGGVTDFNAAALANVRLLAATAKWDKMKPWYCLTSPSYYSDLLNATTLTSSDYGATDAPNIGGNIAMQRYGFSIFEDNSRGLDLAYAFHPDFMHMVMQKEVSFKLSDMHSSQKFGYILSCDVVFGASLGIGGDKKCIKIYNT